MWDIRTEFKTKPKAFLNETSFFLRYSKNNCNDKKILKLQNERKKAIKRGLFAAKKSIAENLSFLQKC